MKFVCDHWKGRKFQIHWRKLEFSVPLKRDTKKTPFYMSSNKLFLKYCLQDNHWVGNAVIKPVDSVEFQKRKSLRKVNNDKSDNFEMEIIDEGALDKALEGPEKHLYGSETWKTNCSRII